MKALGLVFAFWAAVGLLVAWAIGLALALDAELWVLSGALIAPFVFGLSAFMWWAFSEVFR